MVYLHQSRNTEIAAKHISACQASISIHTLLRDSYNDPSQCCDQLVLHIKAISTYNKPSANETPPHYDKIPLLSLSEQNYSNITKPKTQSSGATR